MNLKELALGVIAAMPGAHKDLLMRECMKRTRGQENPKLIMAALEYELALRLGESVVRLK